MTTEDICKMERQMEEMGLSFDDREFFVLIALDEWRRRWRN